MEGIDINAPPAFDIGTRVTCLVAPYRVRLDDGAIVYNKEAFFKKIGAPMEIQFKIGSRIECKLGTSDEWFPGVVIECFEKFAELDKPPYLIRFDYAPTEVRSFWGPPDYIRASNVPQRIFLPELRFGVGDRVECDIGQDAYLPGTVIQTWYTEENNFQSGYMVPYQIQLDIGNLIYAPIDSEDCVRKSIVPAPDCWICFDNQQSADNLIVRECACKGGQNGFVHVDCLVKLALSKIDFNIEPSGEDDSKPFTGCITCREDFDVGSHCGSALRKVCYYATMDLDIDNTWNKMATTMMSELLVENKEYDEALKRR